MIYEEDRLQEEDRMIRHGLATGERVVVFVHLPKRLVRKIVNYAERHSEDVSLVIEQAMTRALREQKL